jgi:hypothetical protein
VGLLVGVDADDNVRVALLLNVGFFRTLRATGGRSGSG